MKNKILTILALALLSIGCDKREIPTYNTGRHYIEFENATVDSTMMNITTFRLP